jgi:ribonuclease HI
MNFFDFENTVLSNIVIERRNIIVVAGYAYWVKDKKQIDKAAFAYTIYDNDEKSIIRQDVLPCTGIESIYQLELVGVLTSLSFTTENVIVIKATQQPLISGINGDVDSWAENDWITKKGSPAKHCELWQFLYDEKKRLQMIALPLEDSEKRRLQTLAKARIS